MGSAITGWGEALPERVVTNDDFAARLDTSDEWIVARTGIRERRMGGTTSELAIEAGRAALKSAGVDGSEVDLLVLATTTPDQTIPATSAVVHDALGCKGGAFDLNAACAGFVYALVTADSLLRAGHRRALVIGSETLSKVTDQDDRSTAVLFGDGAAAIVLESGMPDELIVAYDLGVDGAATPLLYANHGGYIHMEGREVFRRAVRCELDSITNVLTKAGIGPQDVALFVPHQANVRIIEAVNERVGLTMEQTAIVLDRTGNTSAASIPLALAEAADAGRVAEGDLVLLSGFGAGMTWASAIIRWGQEGLAR
ncbi:MAG: 3-oxoacyl-(acyl-carrier-protein) synthase [Acidimicrobiaceae bacterium]|jgi:3-oxoacyl-[acyl-carrier-protein] synthase-3|nr:3-oxoacyl-(acyl-carrier-protein) synthase [Acidimicrobiaceae bacterium]